MLDIETESNLMTHIHIDTFIFIISKRSQTHAAADNFIISFKSVNSLCSI